LITEKEILQIKNIRILPRKETMIVVYPIVAANFIISETYVPMIFLIPLVISMVVTLAMSMKIITKKILELKATINERNGR
jgi:hypothetical protein